MMTYIVIGICVILLALVVFISAKPISMGIEARRNVNLKSSDENNKQNINLDSNDSSITDELLKLNELKKDGVLTQEEYEQAKKKLLT
jgi:flagellar biosynthesis/type III secretory pathway M-ring protein FliF/YscJ|tara:strand:- start:101 stop:364 length:264 start_codon:yes stop_codon:yes gene_type:complete